MRYFGVINSKFNFIPRYNKSRFRMKYQYNFEKIRSSTIEGYLSLKIGIKSYKCRLPHNTPMLCAKTKQGTTHEHCKTAIEKATKQTSSSSPSAVTSQPPSIQLNNSIAILQSSYHPAVKAAATRELKLNSP